MLLETTKKAKSGATYSLACHLYRILRSGTCCSVLVGPTAIETPNASGEKRSDQLRRQTGQFSIKNQDENLLPWVKSSH